MMMRSSNPKIKMFAAARTKLNNKIIQAEEVIGNQGTIMNMSKQKEDLRRKEISNKRKDNLKDTETKVAEEEEGNMEIISKIEITETIEIIEIIEEAIEEVIEEAIEEVTEVIIIIMLTKIEMAEHMEEMEKILIIAMMGTIIGAIGKVAEGEGEDNMGEEIIKNKIVMGNKMVEEGNIEIIIIVIVIIIGVIGIKEIIMIISHEIMIATNRIMAETIIIITLKGIETILVIITILLET
jgi:hypothetical protein